MNNNNNCRIEVVIISYSYTMYIYLSTNVVQFYIHVIIKSKCPKIRSLRKNFFGPILRIAQIIFYEILPLSKLPVRKILV